MIAFWRSARKSSVADRHAAAGADAAVPDMEGYAAALQLRDADPVHTYTATAYTATEELRRQDPKYVQLWPSDLPHRRR